MYVTDWLGNLAHNLKLGSRRRVSIAMQYIDPLDLVETMRESLMVLEPDLTVRFANRAFCKTFAVAYEDTVGRKLYELGNGQWDIPQLRSLIQSLISEHASIEAFEVDHVFPAIGRRVMLLNARRVHRRDNNIHQILLVIENVTERKQLERERSLAHQRIEILLLELTHRVKNSLQTVASIVRLESGRHKSGQGKRALQRVSERINAIGRLYSNLEKAGTIEVIEAAIYLKEVCVNLIASVQQEEGGKTISLKTDLASELLPAAQAIPIGLIVNELVMNAVKYAFPDEAGGTVMVSLRRESGELRLTVADDGVGADSQSSDSGLGGRLVENFAQQLGGRVERVSGSQGTIVCLILPAPDGPASGHQKESGFQGKVPPVHG